VIGLPIIMICGLIVFKIFGDEYKFEPTLALLSGFTGICTIIDALYATLMSSIGIKGIKIVSFASIILALVNILFNLILIHRIGIEGALIATIISYCTCILVIFSKRKYIYDREEI
jgi:O-antigen/teichoic acid export membrane protein